MRADGPEHIGPIIALILRSSRARALGCPSPCEAIFLADARFVLEPDLYLYTLADLGLEGCQRLWVGLFLKASKASGSWL